MYINTMCNTNSAAASKTVELYNHYERVGLSRRERGPFNGWLVRVKLNGETTFVKFGRDEEAARRFAATQ